MNGINYSSLLSNTSLFSNQTKSVQEDTKYKTGTAVGKESSNATENADHDTVEINGQSRVQKAGYDRPKRVQQKPEEKYKALDANGIQEGIELSDAAMDLLKELREKYGNMEISVAKWSTDEEQDYYARGCQKDYSVLIDPELLEQMAADEEVRAEYEAILDQADDNSAALTEALGEDADQIKNFSITIDANGKVSYAVQLIKDFEERNAKRAESSKKTAEEIQEEKLEERRAKRREEEKERLERITADSIDELIEKIKNQLYPEEVEEEIVIEETPVEDKVEEQPAYGKEVKSWEDFTSFYVIELFQYL